MSSGCRWSPENYRRPNGVKGMIKLGINYTGARQLVTAAIAALMLSAGACKADELGPSCKQYLQLKQQCLSARADTIESNGYAQKAREIRRGIPFEMHQAIHMLAKSREFSNADLVEHRCAQDAWYIQNANSTQNPSPERSVQLCSVATSWPENYKITPDYDQKVEARIRKMEEEIGFSR